MEKIMFVKNLTAIPVVLALSACGGGGGGATNPTQSPQTSPATLQTVNAGAGRSNLATPVESNGIAIATHRDGNKSTIYSKNIAALVQSANSGSNNFLSVEERAEYSSSTSEGNYTTKVGTSTVNGTQVSFKYIEDNSSGASMSFVDMPTGISDVEFVSGTAFSAPSIYHNSNGETTSTYTLTGIQALSPTQGVEANASGDFTFTVEFINDYWTYRGSSGNYRLSASGLVGSDGQFSDGDAIVSTSGNPYSSAEVVGNLHGQATGVSGSFFTTDTDKAVVNGLFIGSR